MQLAPYIAVMKTLGGSGATTVATHLAASLGASSGGTACVIDLDLQAGDASSYLGCTPRLTLTDLLDAKERLDEDLLQSVACDGGAHVEVIAAPADIVPIESVDFDELVRVITLARRNYDYVVVDLPATLTNWSLSAIYAANMTVMVGNLSVPSLRHAKRQIDFLLSMGISRDAIQVVLNRAEKGLFKTISKGDAESALKHSVLATIADDAALLRAAQDQGQLAEAVQRRSRFVKDVHHLADQIVDRLTEAQ